MRGIVVTGASSGLGAALAQAYASPGVMLGLIGRDAARLALTAERCRAMGAVAKTLAHDVADAAPLAEWLAEFDHRASVDILIANAGISAGPAPGAHSEGLQLTARQIATNLLGVVNTIEPMLPAFLGRRRGTIAIIASVSALRGLPYSPGYSASKAGARAYGEALRALLEPAGIRVCVVCPGFFSSPMTDRWKGPTPFLVSLEQATSIVKRGIDRGRRRLTFPWPLALCMRLADLIPPVFGDAILRDFRFHIEK